VLSVSGAFWLPGTPVQAQDTTRVERLIDSLPLRDRVAQLIMPWIRATIRRSTTARSRHAGLGGFAACGGIIVSIGSPLDVASKLNRCRPAPPGPADRADLESGSTFRLIGGTPFPPIWAWPRPDRKRDAYEVGRVTALEGRAVGIHITFAPVADVNNNPANPIINTRSFGEDPQMVGVLVRRRCGGLQRTGCWRRPSTSPAMATRHRLTPGDAGDPFGLEPAEFAGACSRSGRRLTPAWRS